MTQSKKLDRFSKQARKYLKSRPKYPTDIYEYLCDITPSKKRVWDCGTGNGQAAIQLAEFFENVYATDLSKKQIENAYTHERIIYEVCSAEDAQLEAESIDLVTVAQAVHWFNLEEFYKKVNLVLKPNGIIALWAYGSMKAHDDKVDDLFQKVGRELLKDYWDKNVKKIWSGYESLNFPFKNIEPPKWKMTFEWTKGEFTSYIESWSAAQKYKELNNSSILNTIQEELQIIWPNSGDRYVFETPLTSRVGQKL